LPGSLLDEGISFADHSSGFHSFAIEILAHLLEEKQQPEHYAERN